MGSGASSKPNPKAPAENPDDRGDSTDDSDSSDGAGADAQSDSSSCVSDTSETSLAPWQLDEDLPSSSKNVNIAKYRVACL